MGFISNQHLVRRFGNNTEHEELGDPRLLSIAIVYHDDDMSHHNLFL